VVPGPVGLPYRKFLVAGLCGGPIKSPRYAELVRRKISGYHQDSEGDWVAELSCGHGQHVRHRPPFLLREWILDPGRRDTRLGIPLDCPLCDRAELPDDLRLIRTSPHWDEHTMPAGLKRSHQIAAGTWGRIVVHDGSLRFVARTEPELNVIVGPGSTQAIPPEVVHNVQPLDQVRFSIDFLSIPRSVRGTTTWSPNRLPKQVARLHAGLTCCAQSAEPFSTVDPTWMVAA
jgi:tellurite methyltransferase